MYNFTFNNLTNSLKIISLQGGSRSSKTYSIIQMVIVYCQVNKNKNKIINIFRNNLTWCKQTIMLDAIDILNTYELDYEFNKSDSVIKLYGNVITFKGLDDPQRIKGLRQDVAILNEATDLNFESYSQIRLRTTEHMWLDYNPCISSHWVYDLNSQNVNNKNYLFFISKPIDNPFLPQATLDLINSWKPTPENIINGSANENKYNIYGLGIKGVMDGLVFPNIKWIKEFPIHLIGNENYAIDFGFVNDPTAILRAAYEGNNVYVELLCYEKGLTTDNIASIIKQVNIGNRLMYGDSAEPRLISELSIKHKIKLLPVKKGTIINGINILNNYNIYIVEHPKARVEAENYRYKKFNDGYTNEPIDDFNHFFDALRYYAQMFLSLNNIKNRLRSSL